VAGQSDAPPVALPGLAVPSATVKELKVYPAPLAAAYLVRRSGQLVSLQVRWLRELVPQAEDRPEAAASVPTKPVLGAALPEPDVAVAPPGGSACLALPCFALGPALVRRVPREKWEKRSPTEDAGAAAAGPRAVASAPPRELARPAEPRAQLPELTPEQLPAQPRRRALPVPPPARRSR